MTLRDLLGFLSEDDCEAARHVVIANLDTGKRCEIDYVTTDADGVLNIVTRGEDEEDGDE